MSGDVPSAPVVVHGGGVPPVSVELAISESQHFSDDIEP